jgi:cytochrome c553
MNRLTFPLLKSLLVASLVLCNSASAATPAAVAKADPAKGGTLYDAGDAARGLPACMSCHGAAGNSTMVANPKLAGQIEAYTHKQLVDFTTPNRQNPIMTPYSKMLTEDEKRHIAAYLATQKAKPGAAKNKDTVELGRKIYRGGIAEKGVAACASCHGATGSGIPAQYPRLSGQHQDYT